MGCVPELCSADSHILLHSRGTRYKVDSWDTNNRAWLNSGKDKKDVLTTVPQRIQKLSTTNATKSEEISAQKGIAKERTSSTLPKEIRIFEGTPQASTLLRQNLEADFRVKDYQGIQQTGTTQEASPCHNAKKSLGRSRWHILIVQGQIHPKKLSSK